MKKPRTYRIDLSRIDQLSDIGVEGKPGAVMIFANEKGRAAVARLWPSLRWRTDDIFRLAHADDWLFTHVVITANSASARSWKTALRGSPRCAQLPRSRGAVGRTTRPRVPLFWRSARRANQHLQTTARAHGATGQASARAPSRSEQRLPALVFQFEWTYGHEKTPVGGDRLPLRRPASAQLLFSGTSPSDSRALQNLRADIARAERRADQ